ncbi:hypothetical protein BZG36_00265 [Bifiguratus adelaidae]|uniref:Cytochrome P450 n=1 Tax=Bifiguratus adelaidae TaxID=1938954 RepID=A0A261Y837_9FUNG|nr:hypothetical protein BZG36_00265 [Bifiguratus adelaidae]
MEIVKSENAPIIIASIAAVAGLATTLSLWRKSGRDRKYLPMPPTLPVLGNIHLINGRDPITCFAYWGQKLGHIFRFRMGANDWIIINDAAVGHELCSRRGAVYNSRSTENSFLKILTKDFHDMASTPYGEDWRKRRRIFMDAMGLRTVPVYVNYINAEAQSLIKNLAAANAAPVDPTQCLMLFTFNVILKIMADERLKDPNEPWLQEGIDSQAKLFGYLGPSGNPVTLFPILRYLPQSWVGPNNQEVRDFKKAYDARLQGILDRVSTWLANGEDIKCFCKDLLEKQKEGAIDSVEIIELLNNTLSAGLETSSTTLAWLIAELANHPYIQEDLHEEVGKVMKADDSPSYNNAFNIPLLQACIRETMHLHPAGPLGLPHATSKDDIYNGYFIPKESTVILNLYTMNRDPVKYPEPNNFNPYRYLDDVQQLSSALANGKIEDRDHTSFGFGRRICAGIHIAETELLSAAAALVWAFDIMRAGPELIDTVHYKLGLTMSPLPFEVQFIKRNDALA